MDLSKISDHDLRSELYRREEKKIREKWLTFPKDVKPCEILLLNDSAHDLSMYIMAYVNSEKKVATFFDATSKSFKKWKKDGVKITGFSDVDCVELIDKRLGIK